MDAIVAMSRLASDLLASLDDDQIRAVRGTLDDPELREWTYLPGDRPGLSLEHMNAGQRETAMALLEQTHSGGGEPVVTGAIEVERIRRQLEAGVDTADGPAGGDRFWFCVLGEPGGEAPWGWRINGHHLAVHVVVVGERVTVTPHFVGAEPAEVRTGPHAGRRLLAPEEDLARELVTDLDPDQRRQAVFADSPPRDILTRHDPVADPSLLPAGLSHGQMSARQQDLVQRLVRRYLQRAPAPYAETCWLETVEAGLDHVAFAWAGAAARGGRHYYCVRAPQFLIEYDNTQDGGNHAHSVWRHLRDDWGGDALRDHYKRNHEQNEEV